MPIYDRDNKLMLAEDMSQDDTGGGRMSGAEAPNGQVSTLFQKLARLTFLGKWRGAKAYQWVDTDSAETAAEAHVVLTRGPSEPLVDVILAKTGSHTDRLPDLRTYMASYQIRGPLEQIYLQSDAVVGQDTIVLWSRLEWPIPRAGSVLYLRGAGAEEAVKLVQITSEVRTYFDGEQGFERRLLTVKLYKALGRAWSGSPVSKLDPASPPTAIYSAIPNSGVRFYGVQPLGVDAHADDITIKAASIYSRAVPASYSPVSLTGQPAFATGTASVTSGGETFACPAPTHASQILVGEGNRESVYIWPIEPQPAPGTVVALVRILDEWYTVTETPALNIEGMTLTVDSQGVATLSLGANFPDLDTPVIFQWASAIHFIDRAGTAEVSPILLPVELPSTPEPGSLTFNWTSGGNARTAAVGIDGQITGHATGFVVGARGVLRLTANLPDANTAVAYSYTPRATFTETVALDANGDGALAHPPEAGSVVLSYTVIRQDPPQPPSLQAAGQPSRRSIGATMYNAGGSA